MNKRYIFLSIGSALILGLIISGCQRRPPGQQPIQPTPNSKVTFTPFASLPTAVELQPTVVSPEVASPVPPGCTAISPKPTPGPTEASLFPAVHAEEWVKGPPDASVTFVEYSDFQ